MTKSSNYLGSRGDCWNFHGFALTHEPIGCERRSLWRAEHRLFDRFSLWVSWIGRPIIIKIKLVGKWWSLCDHKAGEGLISSGFWGKPSWRGPCSQLTVATRRSSSTGSKACWMRWQARRYVVFGVTGPLAALTGYTIAQMQVALGFISKLNNCHNFPSVTQNEPLCVPIILP